MRVNIPVVTRHLSGFGMVPHDWQREYPNDPRYVGETTNYAQIKVWSEPDGSNAYCDVWFNQPTI